VRQTHCKRWKGDQLTILWIIYGRNDCEDSTGRNDCEDGTLIGIFTTEKLAQFVYDHYDENFGKWKFKHPANEYDVYFDSVDVISMNLNKVQVL
jgi:hypothetical protein